ncbi:NADPH-dependent F420 reductase [Catellatospora tritici]|uniref:NADPH-dependent F420 reductase n=1 Tax=Catellatospora tritici TaxID=2851566 RepID=UPI001C2D6DCB|nr:NADPH-dependent F420 reductase [Catellatospora tritici]MBV1848709.1 NADPH-dependent F420 reductase [Catellatospora tritici]
MALDLASLPDVTALTVGILGGTGDQGRGLAYRLALAGQHVLIGSRSAERAAAAAGELASVGRVEGGANAEVASRSDVVIVAVPYAGHAELLTELAPVLADKIVVDCVNPLGFDKQGPYALVVEEGSAAQQAEKLLPNSRVTAAFHHVSAELLADPSVNSVELDVLVLGDDREAVAVVQALAGRIAGMRGVHAGRLRNAGQIEAFTANLIAINKRYKVHAGVRVTDL